MNRITASKSFLNASELAHIIERHYGVSNVRCQLITATMRDVYLVTSDISRYVLMIYRHGQRTCEQVMAEWQFVQYLAENGISVAPAIPMNDGEYVIALDAPEGVRYGVLSTYVAGDHLRRRQSAKAVQAYGQLIGQIHVLADTMPFMLDRPLNDIGLILQSSVDAFAAESWDHPDAVAYLCESSAILQTKVMELKQDSPAYGMIHGDVIRANALVADDGTVTVIDFDLCGLGWRAYDIASYLHTIRQTAEEHEFEQAFLSGYHQSRTLTPTEERMLPVFDAVRAIFSIGIPAMNVYHWGSAFANAFLDGSLKRLKSSMTQIA